MKHIIANGEAFAGLRYHTGEGQHTVKTVIGYTTTFVAGFAACALLWKWAQNPPPVKPTPPVKASLVPASRRVTTPTRMVPLPSVSEAVAKVAPAVVNIDITGKRKVAGWFGAMRPNSTERFEGYGSGIVLTPDGYVLTNNHVVEPLGGADGQGTITLIDEAGTVYNRVSVIGRDKASDLAVLKIHGVKNLPVAKLGDSEKVRVGDWAIAVGNAMGFNSTVTMGIVSALNRSATNTDNEALDRTIQTDAAINPGNSGGALADTQGRVIGINTVIATANGGNIGLGFAIPINTAKRIADNLIAHGRVERPYLGIIYSPVESVAPHAIPPGITLPTDKRGAVLITSERPAVLENSPAAKSGLQEWDVIRMIDGKVVRDIDQIRRAVRSRKVGDAMRLTIWRSGQKRDVTILLEAMPEGYEKQVPNATAPDGVMRMP